MLPLSQLKIHSEWSLVGANYNQGYTGGVEWEVVFSIIIILLMKTARFGCHVVFLMTLHISTCTKFVHCSEILLHGSFIMSSVEYKDFEFYGEYRHRFGVSPFRLDNCVVVIAPYLA